jgi:hypothetical protein
VQYVGFAPSNYTVVPLPALVEAYLNFGVIGVWLVMLLLGILYRHLDSWVTDLGRSPLAVGLFAYVVWHLLNIEQNLFLIMLPTIKTVVLVLIATWVYTRAAALVPRRSS